MKYLKLINLELLIGLTMLVFAVWFNLNLYKLEPTVRVDPNDNTFQFALVYRANEIWDFANRECPKNLFFPVCHMSYMVDHWVHNWAQGYNLPFYYSHIPQIVIVGSYRFIHWIIGLFGNSFISLFSYYHWFVYLLLCFFPLPVFFALRIIGLPWIISGVGAALATHVSTDGLYGLDPPSFLWRGWGLSSQLFAMIWLPLAIAYSYKYFSSFSISKYKSLRDLILNHIAVVSPLPLITNYLEDRGVTKYSQFEYYNNTIINSSVISVFVRGVIKFLMFASRASGKILSSSGVAGQSVNTNHDTLPAQAGREVDMSKDNFHYHREAKYFWLAVLFTVLTVSGHLGIGMMAMLSLPVLAFSPTLVMLLQMVHIRLIYRSFTDNFVKLALLGTVAVFILSYWIIPTVLYGNYHNFSVWDPLWKFHSFGWKDVVVKFLNGELFDWGRAPWYTTLVIVGAFFAALFRSSQLSVHTSTTLSAGNLQKSNKDKINTNNISPLNSVNRQLTTDNYFPFALLFVFWLLMYFGRTTWGGLIDLIPGMSEQHISRFIVGVHIAGIFLAPMGIYAMVRAVSWAIFRFFSTKKKLLYEDMPQFIIWVTTLAILYFIGKPIYKQTIYYNELNDKLIIQSNAVYDKQAPEVNKLMDEFRKRSPARVFVGRGGGWGKDFLISETTMFMHVSTYSIPTALWLPETWSPNSDTEQYFAEDVARDYDIYNLRWIGAPVNVKPQPFWKEIKRDNTWVLYEAPTSGYFTVATRNMKVVTDKYSFANIIHQWIQSEIPSQKLYPELTFTKPKNVFDEGVPVITMLDEANYQTMQNRRQNIFDINPIYGGDSPDVKLLGPEEVNTDMIFKTKVEVGQNCKECLVVLKQTYHPDWVATIDGKSARTITVFPFHIGIPVSEPGIHSIVLSYQPHPAKIPLILISFIIILILLYPRCQPLISKILRKLNKT